ncbi:hypothetical protein B5M09_007776 [Aphanomyces astaci]|uniref:Uncharacterized protein n=1 Tax=Aphanomyces astaci TaxID=112090 RepID=A0A3R7X6A8_APHAT|nr:hypothetical protein B5M09_007776 [Aphanomyces astaci]
MATGLAPLEDDDGARVSTPAGSPRVTPPTDRPETRSPLKRPTLASEADLALVPTSPLARTVQERYGDMGWRKPKETSGTLNRVYLYRFDSIESNMRLLADIAFYRERLPGTVPDHRQDEFQKVLTYLRDSYTRGVEVARAQVTNEANETLHREAEKNSLSWEDRARELERQLALKCEQREGLLVRDKDSELLYAERVLEVRRKEDRLRQGGLISSLREKLRTFKRNHQEEILLVREATRDEDNSKGVANDLLQSQYDQNLASAQDEARSKALGFEERSVQYLTLSQAYAELERQWVQLQVEEKAVELQQTTPRKTNNAPYATYGIPTLSRMGSLCHRRLRSGLPLPFVLTTASMSRPNRDAGSYPSSGAYAQPVRVGYTQPSPQSRGGYGGGYSGRTNPLAPPGSGYGAPFGAAVTLKDLLVVEDPHMEDPAGTMVVLLALREPDPVGTALVPDSPIHPGSAHQRHEFIQKTLSRKVAEIPDNSRPKSIETIWEYAWRIADASRKAGLQVNRTVVMMVNGCSDAEVAVCLRGASVRPETIEISLDYLIERDVGIDRRMDGSRSVAPSTSTRSARSTPRTPSHDFNGT